MSECCKGKTFAVYGAGLAGAFLIMGAMVWLMRHYTAPAPINSARIAERQKASSDVAQASKTQLENYGWIDQAKGIARLPIQQAMDATIKAYQNPAAARSNLLARVEKAYPPPPPPPPEKPSAFE